jgi:hypothetical protein
MFFSGAIAHALLTLSVAFGWLIAGAKDRER